MSSIAVMTTTDSLDEARAIAAALVERRLAACAQISPVQSYYTWEGEVRNDDEFRVLVKTTDARYADVEAAILELHSYDLPAVIAFDVSQAYGPYADWIAASVSGTED